MHENKILISKVHLANGGEGDHMAPITYVARGGLESIC